MCTRHSHIGLGILIHIFFTRFAEELISNNYEISSHIGAEDLYVSSFITAYRKTSSISRTKSQNLNVSCILLQLSSLNPLKPCVKLRMKM